METKKTTADGPVKLLGHSDDIVVIEGIAGGSDETGDGAVITVGYPEAAEGMPSHGVIVRMNYGPEWHGEGVWVASVAPIGEDTPIRFPVRIEMAEGYTPIVTIDCPPGTPVSYTRDGDDEDSDDE